MGMFSYLCACNHPLLSPYATDEINVWMNDTVAVLPDGTVIAGEYDGYGRIDAGEVLAGNEFWFKDGDDGSIAFSDAQVWHRACWELAGKPMTWTQASPSAPDQGFFFVTETEHDVPRPTAEQPVPPYTPRSIFDSMPDELDPVAADEARLDDLRDGVPDDEWEQALDHGIDETTGRAAAPANAERALGPRWMVNVSVQGEGYVIVDADSEQEALERASFDDVVLTKVYDFHASHAFEYPDTENPAERAVQA